VDREIVSLIAKSEIKESIFSVEKIRERFSMASLLPIVVGTVSIVAGAAAQ
jgi:hypothetical protein